MSILSTTTLLLSSVYPARHSTLSADPRHLLAGDDGAIVEPECWMANVVFSRTSLYEHV